MDAGVDDVTGGLGHRLRQVLEVLRHQCRDLCGARFASDHAPEADGQHLLVDHARLRQAVDVGVDPVALGERPAQALAPAPPVLISVPSMSNRTAAGAATRSSRRRRLVDDECHVGVRQQARRRRRVGAGEHPGDCVSLARSRREDQHRSGGAQHGQGQRDPVRRRLARRRPGRQAVRDVKGGIIGERATPCDRPRRGRAARRRATGMPAPDAGMHGVSSSSYASRGCGRRILPAHPVDALDRDRRGRAERLGHDPVVRLRILGGHAPLVAEPPVDPLGVASCGASSSYARRGVVPPAERHVRAPAGSLCRRDRRSQMRRRCVRGRLRRRHERRAGSSCSMASGHVRSAVIVW